MKSIAFFLAALGGGVFVACVVNQAPATPPTIASADPSTDVPAATASATTTATATTTTTTTATTTATATATSTTTATATTTATTDGGAPSLAVYQACAMDADCVAVPKVGCCQTGRMEAIATTQVDKYKASFVCPPPRPMCPMSMILETRQPECNNGSHLCEMVPVENILCGGFIPSGNIHQCPDGYHCQRSKTPDLPGKCIK